MSSLNNALMLSSFLMKEKHNQQDVPLSAKRRLGDSSSLAPSSKTGRRTRVPFIVSLDALLPSLLTFKVNLSSRFEYPRRSYDH